VFEYLEQDCFENCFYRNYSQSSGDYKLNYTQTVSHMVLSLKINIVLGYKASQKDYLCECWMYHISLQEVSLSARPLNHGSVKQK